MPNTKNVSQMDLLTEKYSRAKSVILTNYAGLSVKQQTKLRSQLKDNGGEFIIAKNTLLARTFGKDAITPSLQGQTGVVFSYDDEVKALKALVKFSADSNLPEIKDGIVGGVVYKVADILKLSKLPGKEELLGQVLMRINAPATNLLSVLNGNVRKLVYVLSSYQEKLGGKTA